MAFFRSFSSNISTVSRVGQ